MVSVTQIRRHRAENWILKQDVSVCHLQETVNIDNILWRNDG